MRLRFVLPPGWLGFPLTDPASCERQIERAVRAMPLDDGVGARMRRELHVQLTRQTEAARDGGATYLALAGPRSAPLSGSLLVTPVRRRVALDDPAWVDTLDGAHQTFAIDGVGRTTRVVRQRSAAVDPADDAEELPTLSVDYWIAGPGGRPALISCSTPLVAHEEAMVRLFDAVIRSAEWSRTGDPS